MKHFICTRWNLLDDNWSIYDTDKVKENYGKDFNPEKWMSDRKILFEKYTLSSMIKQTNKNFIWLLDFDERTPKEFYEPYLKYDFVKVIHCYDRTYIRGLYGKDIHDGNILITTRLDNDDCISETFIDCVQKMNKGFTELVDANGYQYDAINDKWYVRHLPHTNSSFISLIEVVGEDPLVPIKTCNFKPHQNMNVHIHRSEFMQEATYCQILHGDNLGNKIDGTQTNLPINNFF